MCFRKLIFPELNGVYFSLSFFSQKYIMSNPLLNFTGLPRFAEITAEDVEPAISELLQDNRQQIDALLTGVQEPDWYNFIEPLE